MISVTLNGVKGEPFGSATPYARLDMGIVAPLAAKVFFDAPLGQEFDVYFSAVSEEQEREKL